MTFPSRPPWQLWVLHLLMLLLNGALLARSLHSSSLGGG